MASSIVNGKRAQTVEQSQLLRQWADSSMVAAAPEARDAPGSAPLPNLPLTLEEAAWPLFRWSYQTLRANLKTLIAQGMPAVKEGRRYLLYPAHIEAWRAARYPVDARRALRLGGYQCSDAAIQKSGISTTR
jgi:hypothetical protein